MTDQNKLRVLIVEDSEDDTLLIVRELKRGGYEPIFERVETEEAMRSALERQEWDIIISDYRMPSFSGSDALRIFKEKGLDIPFIIVSGTIGEDIAVETMVSGAHDYVMKTNLVRLAPAVSRELRNAGIRRRHRLAEEERARTGLRLKALLDLYRMGDAPLETVTAFVVETCLKIGGSELAFVGFIDEDSGSMHTHLWSHRAMDQCSVNGKPTVFSLEHGGLWAEAIRQKKPVIVNDYAVHSPNKKGYPEGHLPLVRFMAVPVVDKKNVVLVAGLANKETPYDEFDVTHISLFLEGMWTYIQKRGAEKKLREEKEKFSLLTEKGPFGMVMSDKDGATIYVNPKFTETLGYELSDIPNTKEWFRRAYPDPSYRHEVVSDWQSTLNAMELGEQRSRTFTVTCKDGGRKIVRFSLVLFEGGKNIVAVEDITERVKAEESLKESEERFRLLVESAPEGIFVQTLGKFAYVNKAALRMFGATTSGQLVGKPVLDMFHPDYHAAIIERIRLLNEERKGVPLMEQTYLKIDGTHFPAEVSAVPFLFKGHSGALVFFRDISERKKTEEQVMRSAEKLRKSLVGTIQVISIILETRDPYTGGHQRRVSKLARSIAQKMELSKDAIDSIRMAGTIHDIGKMSVPAEILSKPTRLSEVEMEIVKIHPQTGYDILKVVELPSPIAEMVLQHHERLDGSGYPQGLKDGEIILEAQILAVADVVEAMASHRPYRPALGLDAALEEVEKNRGVLYHPNVVDACLKLFLEETFDFEK